MAEKSYLVKLTARTDQYIAAFKAAEQSTENFASKSNASIANVGKKMQDVGGKMTTRMTLPLAGLAGAAVKMSNDFDSLFGQMVGLAGVAAEDVDGLKESVLDLAGETAVAPKELAEALYFAASAGLDTAGAMDAVTVAAKASAAGLGSTQDVVGLVASAVASYGEENLSAAQATDILTATIREGRAEPAELASTLGRVLPIASQLGVSFDEVGGTVAYLSNVFGDTNRTVTATQGLMVKLVSPTKQGRDALDEMGTSVEELHAAISKDGILGALDLLRTKGFAGNQQALRGLFDDIEGYQAALALLNADQAALTGIMEGTANASGSLGEAFENIDADAQKMKQSWVDIQIALIQVGEVVGPIAADVASGAADVASAFADLDPVLQKVIIGILGAAAAAGPLLVVTGSLVRAYATLKTAMAASNVTMGSAAATTKTLAAQLGLAYAAVGLTHTAIKGLRGETDWLYDDVSALEKPFQLLARGSYWLGGGMESAESKAAKLDERASDLYGTMTSGVFTMDQLTDRLREQNVEQEVANRIIIAFRAQLDASAEAEANLAEATELAALATEEQADSTDIASTSMSEYRQRTNDAAGALEGAYDAGFDVNAMLAEQRDRAAEVVEEVNAIALAFGRLRDEIGNRTEYRNLQNQFDRVEQAAVDAWDASVEGSEDAERKARDHSQALDDLRLDVIDYAEQVGDIPPEQVSEIIAMIDQGSLTAAEAALAELERQRNVRVAVTSYYSSVGASKVPVQSTYGGPRASGGPVRSGHHYDFVERGPEVLTVGGRSTLVMGSQDGQVTPLDGKMTPGMMSSASNGGGATYVLDIGGIRVVAGIGTDGAMVGRQIVGAIREYESGSGTGWRAAS